MRTRRFASAVMSLALVGGLIGAAFILGRSSTRTTTAQPAAASDATVVARSGALEETRQFQVSMQWQSDRSLLGRLGGTITSVGLLNGSASVVDEGSVLYAVDGRPVVAMSGEQPVFRAIEDGTKGDDVRQVQLFLQRVSGDSLRVDGTWGNESARAWVAWQHTQHLPESATITLGEIVFVPNLPRLVAPGEALVLGGVLTTLDKIASLLRPIPLAYADVSKDMASILPAGISVDLEGPSGSISARVSTRRTATETGNIRIELDLGSVGCAAWCSSIMVGAATSFRGIAQISPLVKGTILPIGVLRTGTGNGTSVVLANGAVVDVIVRVKVGAEAVVEGVKPGDRVTIPAAASDHSLKK